MTDECINYVPFTLSFDENGNVTISPESGASSCWWQVINRKLHRCCWASGKIYCSPVPYIGEILSEHPDDPELSKAE